MRTDGCSIHIIWGKKCEKDVIWKKNCKLCSWFPVYAFPLHFLSPQPFAPPHLNCYLCKHACPRQHIDKFACVFENNFSLAGPCRACAESRKDLVVLRKWTQLSCTVSTPLLTMITWKQVWPGMVWNTKEDSPKPVSVFAQAWWPGWGPLLIIRVHYPLLPSRGWAIGNGAQGERERDEVDFYHPH